MAPELPCPDAHCEPTDWSPDGRSLIVNARPMGAGDVWRVSLETGGIAKAILSEPFPEYDARVSPDGHWLAYVSEEAGRAVVSVRLCGDDAAAAEGFSKATGVGAGLAGQSRWGARIVLTFRTEPGPEGITAGSCSESHP
jgi:dipeptidyl aminopeptidase/acylaminoacyl peptidase